MKFYYDGDTDATFVEEDDGKIYAWTENGRGRLTDFIGPNPMRWHECTEKVANEHIILFKQMIEAL